MDAHVGKSRRVGEADGCLDVVASACMAVSVVAVLEFLRSAKYTLVSRRVEGGMPSEPSNSAMADGFREPASIDLDPLIGL